MLDEAGDEAEDEASPEHDTLIVSSEGIGLCLFRTVGNELALLG